MPDVERPELAGRPLVPHVHALDCRRRRTVPGPRDQPIDGRRVALGDELHLAGRQVPHVPAQPEPGRLPAGEHAEPDALDGAADGDVNPSGHGGAFAPPAAAVPPPAAGSKAFYGNDRGREGVNPPQLPRGQPQTRTVPSEHDTANDRPSAAHTTSRT